MLDNSIKYLFLIILMGLSYDGLLGQINLTLAGNWNFSVPSNDITEAGLDFTGIYSSNTNQVLIDITNANNSNGNFRWRVDIRKSDVDWDANLELYAQRTGNGTSLSGNANNINGGNNFQQVIDSDQTFFSGRRARVDIPVQYEIRNVSVLLPAKTYETTIIYTVTEL